MISVPHRGLLSTWFYRHQWKVDCGSTPTNLPLRCSLQRFNRPDSSIAWFTTGFRKAVHLISQLGLQPSPKVAVFCIFLHFLDHHCSQPFLRDLISWLLKDFRIFDYPEVYKIPDGDRTSRLIVCSPESTSISSSPIRYSGLAGGSEKSKYTSATIPHQTARQAG